MRKEGKKYCEKHANDTTYILRRKAFNNGEIKDATERKIILKRREGKE